MQCPECETELAGETDENKHDERCEATTPTPDEALRADTPPAPCPQCGWSTMWNE